MALAYGETAPWGMVRTTINPRFQLASVGGRYALYAFVPGPVERDAALALVAARRAAFDDENLCVFLIVRDPDSIARVRDALPGVRFILDTDGEVTRRHGMIAADGSEPGGWLLLDPMMRVMESVPLAAGPALFARVDRLPAPGAHAGAEIHAPVLIVPRVFEPEMCRRLIDVYEAEGGQVSGVMREIDGRTVGVVDSFKSRRDAIIQDEDFRRELRVRLARRLIPEIKRALQFSPTRVERYIVACYDADDGGGYFKPHRDNTTKGTAHRRFACSINLNAEEFEGGDLRFPEFGPRAYRPPTGGAVVFSCSMLHEAMPVTRGRRYAFLPFFFDEAAEAVRQQNLQYLDDPAAAQG